jgi:tetratricopeptide (TPR) repeat protein
VLAIGGESGRAFEVSAWEAYFGALPDFREGRWEKAIARIEAGLEERPNHPSLLYNLACAEARSGRTDDAIAHPNAAVAGDPSLASSAAFDTDFDAIRDRPDFPTLS